jgi:hypothetical protein
MDHYTAEAYEHVRKRIVGKIDELEAYSKKYPGQKPGSGDIYNLKNWRRFGAGFAWDPEVYIDIMANPDMSDVELMRALRNTEGTLMKKWGVIDKMPLHHKIALRTGGDLGLRTPVDVWMQTRARLYERFGFNPGNGPANLGAHTQFNEWVHQLRQGGGKDFKQSGAPPSVIEEIRQAEVALHRPGQDLGNLPSQYEPLIGASPAQQAAYLEDHIISQIDRFKQATDFERTQWMNNTFDDGINWFADLGGKGPRISGFSSLNSIEDQELMKQAAKAIKHFDETTGEIKTLSQLTTDAFVAPEAPKLNTKNLYFDAESKEGKKAIQMISNSSGGAHLSQDFQRLAKQRRLARQFANAGGELPFAGWIAGPALATLVGQSPAEAAGDAIPILSEIESDNTADVSREGNLFVDRKTNMVMPTPETADQGKQGLAYKDGKPVAVPYGSVAGEATTSDMFGAFVNQVYEVQKRRFGGIGIGRKKLERQEQLRALPADAAERENALSVGFAGGM